MHDSLRRLDLNLLLVFDALHRHGSVNGAADELAISPSACSHALARLRLALSDQLFVRHGTAMQPTALATQMAGGIGAALQELSNGLEALHAFDPSTSNQTFTLASTEFASFALLPKLLGRLDVRAPKLRLRVTTTTQQDSLDDLLVGRVQFALGFSDDYSEAGEGVESLECFSDDYAVVASADHPRIADSLTLEKYLAERHVAVMPWIGGSSVIDAALTRLGLQREVAVQLPSFIAAPFIVGGSSLLLTLPRVAAEKLSASAGLKVHAAPFVTPGFVLKIFYHGRHASAPSHRWMREQMVAAMRPPATA